MIFENRGTMLLELKKQFVHKVVFIIQISPRYFTHFSNLIQNECTSVT